MRQKSWRVLVVRFALLLLVAIGSVGISGYMYRPVHAATQSITRTENDPITSTIVIDAEGDTIAGSLEPTIDIGAVAPFYFAIQGSIAYTLDMPVAWQPPLVLSGSDSSPVIRNIKQDVYVADGNNPNLPFGFKVSSSVEVYSGDGTLLKTITGNLADTVHARNDIDYALQDSTSIPTTTPYQPSPRDFVGPRNPTTLFILKHILYVTADSGFQLKANPSSPFTHKVDSPS